MSCRAPSRAERLGLWLLLPLVAFGMGVGGLMTWHHDVSLYGPDADPFALIGCAPSAVVDCDLVNTSAYSELLGVPIASLAIGAYAAVGGLAIAGLCGRAGARTLLVVAGAVAVAASVWLFRVSIVELGFVCTWCLRLYGVNAGILLLSLLGGRPSRPSRSLVLASGAASLGLLLLSAGGERLYRTSLSWAPPAALASNSAAQAGTVGWDEPPFSVLVEDEPFAFLDPGTSEP